MQRGLRALELSSEVNPAMARRLGRPRTVLDFGCGAGMNGMLAKKRGAHVTGVESDPALAARAGRVLDQVICLDPSDDGAVAQALGARTFDLILIPTRLEQVSAPEALV